MNDPTLGELTRIDDFSHYLLVSIAGRQVRVVLETGEGLTPRAVEQARRITLDADAFARRARGYAAEQLIDSSQPRPTLDLEAIEIASDGVASCYFADGGAFGGHSVVVYVGRDGDPSDVK
jgi:hypothetical protein